MRACSGTPRKSRTDLAPLVVCLSIAAWLAGTARAGAPSFAITAPADPAVTTTLSTVAVTFSGTATSSPAIRWQSWGVQEDSTGSIIAESLFTGSSFSTTLVLDADAAGVGYTLLVGGVNADAYDVVSLAITVTDTLTCGPTEYECQAQEVADEAISDADVLMADALVAILVLLTDPFDQADVDAAYALVIAMETDLDAVIDQLEIDIEAIRDEASGGEAARVRAIFTAGRNTINTAFADWESSTNATIAAAEATL